MQKFTRFSLNLWNEFGEKKDEIPSEVVHVSPRVGDKMLFPAKVPPFASTPLLLDAIG